MRYVHSLLVVVAAASALFLGGCAAYSDAELSQLNRAGVAHSTLVHMEHGDPLTPEDIIDLSRRGVPSGMIIRHLDRHGFDGLLTRNDVTQLRKAGVRPSVVDATLEASEEFAREHGQYSDFAVSFGVGTGWPHRGYYY